MRLPWWLDPWREVRRLRHDREGYEQRIDDLCETARMDTETIAQLSDDLGKAQRKLAAAVTDARTSGAALSTAQPEFVMTGIPRPDGSKRIMVSRDIEVTAFAMTEMGTEPNWKIGAVLRRLLVIDKPSYGECMAHLATIWANHDRDDQPHPASSLGRQQLVDETMRALGPGDG